MKLKKVFLFAFSMLIFACDEFENATTFEINSLTYSTANVTIKEGEAFKSVAPTVDGNGTISFSISDVSLTDFEGITINDSTGVITVAEGNTLIAGESYIIDIAVANEDVSEIFESAFTIEIISLDLPRNLVYSNDSIAIFQNVDSSSVAPDLGGLTPFTFEVSNTAEIPSFINVNSSTGVISIDGSTSEVGAYTVDLKVSNTDGAATFNEVFVLIILAEPEPATASFTYEYDQDNIMQINFSNTSINAVSYEWDFGDNSTESIESPTHIYENAGEYVVKLTAFNSAGLSNETTQTITIKDADILALAGEVSKTWRLVREGTAMLLASDPNLSQIYWPGASNNGDRPCLFDDEFTFTNDGQFIFDDFGTFWAEFQLFNNVDGCSQNTPEGCIEAIPANMTNACGDDISAWLSGTHSYTYDKANNQVTIIGDGAWIGNPKLGTTTNVLTPQAASQTTFNVEVADGGSTGVDTLYVAFNYDVAYWLFTYVSYDDPAIEPPLVTEPNTSTCSPWPSVSPSIISHSFASNNASEWNLMQPTTSGATLQVGVDDPTDINAPKVGKYIRNAQTTFQELIFKLEPLNAIDFQNMTTITMDVYLPSSNDYSGGLVENVFVGFGATKCPPDWFTDQIEYQATNIALDQWVTVSFNLSAPDFVANPGNGANVYGRNDLDMIYISIGGNNHNDGGEFFMRNFSIQ